jgi:ATP-binding cassette subfamily B (MDR/TAP) protein 1
MTQNLETRYFIKDGTVCESGTHDELLQRREEYYEYVQLQGLSNTE